MNVRTMRGDEIDAVADLHRLVFPAYTSSRLGRGFARRLLRAYHEHPAVVVLVADDGGPSPAGYLVGAPPPVQRQVQRSLTVAAVPGSVALAVRHPSQLMGGLRRAAVQVRKLLGRPAAAGTTAAPAAADPRPSRPPADQRVVLVGARPEARGRGVADALLGAFAGWARDQGAAHADLVVEADNAPARACYVRNGWVVDEHEPDGTRYRLDLTGS